MVAAGALGLGLVAGWAVEFLGLSWASASYRAVMVAGLITVIIALDGTALALAFGCAGFALAAATHRAMLEAIRRRRP